MVGDSKRAKLKTISLIRSQLKTCMCHCHCTSLTKASHEARPDFRAGEVKVISCRKELQRIDGYLQPTKPGGEGCREGMAYRCNRVYSRSVANVCLINDVITRES